MINLLKLYPAEQVESEIALFKSRKRSHHWLDNLKCDHLLFGLTEIARQNIKRYEYVRNRSPKFSDFYRSGSMTEVGYSYGYKILVLVTTHWFL